MKKRRYVYEMNDRRFNMEKMKDERLLWQSEPEKFSLTSAIPKKNLILRWSICGACLVILSVLYYVLASVWNADYSPIAEAIIVICCVYIAFVPVLDRRKVSRQVSYYLTDKRAMAIVDDKDIIWINKKNVKMKFVKAENGCVHILFGIDVDLAPKKYLVSTFVPKKDDNEENTIGMVFFNVKDTEALRAACSDKATV